jgi:hypothetical protein
MPAGAVGIMTTSKFWTSALVAAVLLVSGGEVAKADTLYGYDFVGSRILSVDTTTGNSSVLSTTSVQLPGLVYNPNNGVLYGRDFNSSLYTVNPLTGAATLFDSDPIFGGTGLTFSGDYSKLYSVNNSNQLVSYSFASGNFSVVGATGVSLYDDAIDLATNASGDVYGTGVSGNLVKINTTTGAAQILGNVGAPGNAGYTSIAFGSNGLLYGIGLADDMVYAINTQTLTYTVVGGPVGGDVRGLTNTAGAAAPLPGTATAGLALFGLIGGKGLLARRRTPTVA